MRTKQFELILGFYKALKGWIFAIPFAFFSAIGHTQTMSLEQFNASIEAEENKAYLQFQTDWISFLQQKSKIFPKGVDSSWALRATENYLASTGNLKKDSPKLRKKINLVLHLKDHLMILFEKRAIIALTIQSSLILKMFPQINGSSVLFMRLRTH